MNENIQRWLKTAHDYWIRLSTAKKVGVIVFATLLLSSVIVGVTILRKDPYHLLYSDLLSEDAKAVTKKLGELNVPYQISEDQTSIFIPTSQVANARMQLAKDGIPGQDIVGYEKFDGSTLGMSSYVQRIQYVRAVQGELTRSIQRLVSVKRARVHISIPPKKTFLEEQDAPKASVVLELHSGQAPNKSEVLGIAHLVASAVEGLHVNQVTIVDTKGNFLLRPEDANSGAVPTAFLELGRSIESEYQKRIEELLVPVVGLGKVRAKVTTEIDPSNVNTTEETFDPDKAVLRQTVKNDEINSGSRQNAMGIPGSRSNLPGAEVENPPLPVTSMTNEKNMQNNTYAIPRKVQVVSKPSGTIKRLTVSVIVDGHYNKVEGKDPVFAPRPEEELNRLKDLVANAVGYDPQRRDSITVSCLPFNEHVIPVDEEVVPKFNLQDFLKVALRNGMITLVILLFFFMVLRPFLKWATVLPVERELTLLPKTVAELELARKDEGLLSLTSVANQMDEIEPLEKKEEGELKSRIIEKLEKTPKKGVQVLQEWLEQDELASIPLPIPATAA